MDAGPVRGSAPGARGSPVEQWAPGWLVYVDNLKVLLIAAIIAAHAVLGYAATTDAWSWSDVREVTLSAATESVLLLAFVLTAVVIPLWQWPACIALFGLGVTASSQGWLTAVPDRLRRHSRMATLVAAVAIGALLVSFGALGIDEEQLTGGWRWPALVFAACESAIAVFGAVWLLSVAQRHLDRRLPLVGPAARRSAYGAFMLQGPVLLGCALALRPVPLPADVKALLVGTAAVAGSFALAWLLIRRVPLVARVL